MGWETRPVSCPKLTMVGIVRYSIDWLGLVLRVSGFWAKTHPNPPGPWGRKGHCSPRPKARWGGASPARARPTPPRVTLYYHSWQPNFHKHLDYSHRCILLACWPSGTISYKDRLVTQHTALTNGNLARLLLASWPCSLYDKLGSHVTAHGY